MSVEIMDSVLAEQIKEQCSTGDYEANGCRLDALLAVALTALGFTKTVAAIEKVDCRRA